MARVVCLFTGYICFRCLWDTKGEIPRTVRNAAVVFRREHAEDTGSISGEQTIGDNCNWGSESACKPRAVERNLRTPKPKGQV